MRTNPKWERLQVVGEGFRNYLSRDKTYVDLRGGLLAIHEVAPGRFGSTYCSAGSVRKSHRKRRDGTLLIRASGAALAGLLLFVLLMLLIEAALSDEGTKNYAFSACAIVILSLVTVYSLTNIFRFIFAKPTTWLFFNTNDHEKGLEFWHIPNRSPKLDGIVESLGIAHELAPEENSVSIEHNWSYVYPFKNAVLTAITLFLVIGYLGHLFERPLERYAVESYYILWLSLPPVVGLIYYVRAKSRLSRYHGQSRLAIEKFVLGDFRGAEAALRKIIKANSEDQDALALLMHVHIENDEFAKAAQCLEFLKQVDDEIRYESTNDIELVRTWRNQK